MSNLYPINKRGSCCVVLNCNMRSGTNALSNVKAFKFPKDIARRTAWVRAIRRENWTPSAASMICCKHFIEGKPSSDPDSPDWVPSIFPNQKPCAILHKKKLGRCERVLKKRAKVKKECEDNPSASKKKKKKKPQPKKSDSESTSTDENVYDDNLVYSSSDLEAAVQVSPALVITPPVQVSVPQKEFQFVGKRTVDVNYFVSCLRLVNKHHKSMPCGITEMVICEELIKGALHGILFRCKMCLMSQTVWLENPSTVNTSLFTQENKNTYEDLIRTETGTKDYISPSPTTLPKMPISRNPGVILPCQSQSPVIVQSPLPLIGYPQVANVPQTFFSGSGVNPTDGSCSSFTNPSVVKLKLSVKESIKQEILPAKSTAAPRRADYLSSKLAATLPRRASKRIAQSPRMISKRHADYVSSKSATISTAPKIITQTSGGIPPPSRANIFTQNRFPAQSGSRSIVLSPDNLQKIFASSSSFSGLPPQFQNTLQLQSAQTVSQATEASCIVLPSSSFVPSSQSISAQSGAGTAVPRTIILSPEDLQKILAPSRSFPGLFPQFQSTHPVLQATEASPSVLRLTSQSRSTQLVGSESSSTAPETITPDILIPHVVPVDLNLVKKEKDETASAQPSGTWFPATVVPETITVSPDIANGSANVLAVDLNLVKKEIE